MNDLKTRLTSRKLWITILAAALAYLEGNYAALFAILGGYVGVEGLADITGRFVSGKYGNAPVKSAPRIIKHAQPGLATEQSFFTDEADEPDKSQTPVPGGL